MKLDANEYPHLTARFWTRPPYYAGHNPEGEIVIFARNPTEGILGEANFQAVVNALNEQFSDAPDAFYTWTARHWACGYVEYAMIRPEYLDPVTAEFFEDMLNDYDGYPVIDEHLYSEMEWEAIQKYWEEASESERLELLGDDADPVLATRDYLDDEVDPCGYVSDQLRDYVN